MWLKLCDRTAFLHGYILLTNFNQNQHTMSEFAHNVTERLKKILLLIRCFSRQLPTYPSSRHKATQVLHWSHGCGLSLFFQLCFGLHQKKNDLALRLQNFSHLLQHSAVLCWARQHQLLACMLRASNLATLSYNTHYSNKKSNNIMFSEGIFITRVWQFTFEHICLFLLSYCTVSKSIRHQRHDTQPQFDFTNSQCCVFRENTVSRQQLNGRHITHTLTQTQSHLVKAIQQAMAVGRYSFVTSRRRQKKEREVESRKYKGANKET